MSGERIGGEEEGEGEEECMLTASTYQSNQSFIESNHGSGDVCHGSGDVFQSNYGSDDV